MNFNLVRLLLSKHYTVKPGRLEKKKKKGVLRKGRTKINPSHQHFIVGKTKIRVLQPVLWKHRVYTTTKRRPSKLPIPRRRVGRWWRSTKKSKRLRFRPTHKRGITPCDWKRRPTGTIVPTSVTLWPTQGQTGVSKGQQEWKEMK